jgi:peptide/nickel transport system permease protein
MSVVVFIGLHAVGNPVDALLPPDSTQADRALAIKQLGLDRPLPQQYATFVGNALRGELGRSFVFGEPAIAVVLKRVPATLELALTALALSLAIGIPAGLYAGLRPHGPFDEAVMTASILGYSLPVFWTAIMLILLFAVQLGWLPSTGRDAGTILGFQTSYASWSGISHLILPAVTLSLFKVSLIARLTRSGTRDTLQQEFVTTARAKGLSETRVVFGHVLGNAAIPLTNVIGIELGNLIAFGVVTETIFAWPGAGKLLIDSIRRLDRPVIVAYLLVAAAMFVLINIIVDVFAVALDPRLRAAHD